MKAIINVFLLYFAVVGVMGGTLYGEKAEAIEAIESKYVSVSQFSLKVFTECEAAHSKFNATFGKELRLLLETEKAKYLNKIYDKANYTIKEGIIRKKRLASSKCVIKVWREAQENAHKIDQEFSAAISNIWENNLKFLKEIEQQLYVIGRATKQLRNYAISEINKFNNKFYERRTEAIDWLESSKGQFDEIKSSLDADKYNEEHNKIKDNIPKRLSEAQQTDINQLNNCVNSK